MRDWCGKKWEVPREQGNRQSCPFSGIPYHRVRLFAVSFYVMTKSAAIAFVFKPQIKIYKWPLWRWVNYEFILGLIGILKHACRYFICLFVLFSLQHYCDHHVFVRITSFHQYSWHVWLCIHPWSVPHKHAWNRFGSLLRGRKDWMYDNSVCRYGELCYVGHAIGQMDTFCCC